MSSKRTFGQLQGPTLIKKPMQRFKALLVNLTAA